MIWLSSREYLAVFKKTVSSHEIFLQRISSHPVISRDHNFHVFLEYDQDVRPLLNFLQFLTLEIVIFLAHD